MDRRRERGLPGRLAVLMFLAVTFGMQHAVAQSLPLQRIRLPAGFTIELVARVPGAREMAFDHAERPLRLEHRR